MGGNMMSKLIDRFLQYVKHETTSDESSASVPSTSNQLEFAKILGRELEEIGLSDVSVDEKWIRDGNLTFKY